MGCNSIQSINIPDGVTYVGYLAFSGCNSAFSEEKDAYFYIDNWLIMGLDNSSHITIKDNIVGVADGAFAFSGGVSTITIPSNWTSINRRAFAAFRSLKYATIPDGVKSIETAAFRSCSELESITIPNSVTSIASYAFRDCYSLTSINIPNKISCIENNTFEGCDNLTTVIIPNSVKTIKTHAFFRCDKLESITFLGTMSEWKSIQKETSRITFPEKITIVCTDGTLVENDESNAKQELNYVIIGSGNEAYAAVLNKGTWRDPHVIVSDTYNGYTVTTVAIAAFADSSINSVILPDTITTICDDAFRGTSSIEYVYLPNSLKEIHSKAFSDSSNISRLEFGGTIDQWNAIFKAENWNENSADFTIICTDGKLDKNGNIIQ